MPELEKALAPVRRRVRRAMAWRSAAFGLLAGCLAAAVWVGLDWFRVAYADWPRLGAAALGGALLGSAVGWLRRIPSAALARSVDLRAGLQDRTATATAGLEGEFGQAVARDATERLQNVKPEELYPIRFGRLQAAAVASLAVVAALFTLGNSPAVRGPKTPAERAELQKAGAAVERVAKPLAERPKQGKLAAGDRKLATDMGRLGQDLQQGRLSKEEALRSANKLAEQAEKQARQHAEEAKGEFAKAETAVQKLQQAQLDRAGANLDELKGLELTQQQRDFIEQQRVEQGWQNERSAAESKALDQMGLSESARQLAQLSPEQREQLRQAVRERQEQLQQQLREMEGMPEAERRALERELREMQELMESIQLSEKAQKALEELMKSPEAQQLREKLQEMQQQAERQAQGQQIDPEQLRQTMEQIEKLAEQLDDPAVKAAVKEAMKRAAEELESGKMSAEAAARMMAALGLGSGTGSQDRFADTGKVVKSEKEMETKGTTRKTGVRGQWGEQGEEYSVEIKAPTRLGSKSSVPYRKVLPSYKRAAESAIERNAVPREHEKRVKEYFDALGKG